MANKKLNVGLLFGGKSAEHEISLLSAKNILEALDHERYHPVLIGIDPHGTWHLHQNADLLLYPEKREALEAAGKTMALVPESDGRISILNGEADSPVLDVVFPILHGPFGEDGTVQGLLKLANIPFVGASVLGSAVGMDKDVMKRLLREAGIPIGPYVCVHSDDPRPAFDAITKELGQPLFIKPANLGSSVGISKVSDRESFEKALDLAFEYDRKVVIEAFIQGREIECAVLGNRNPIASLPGEVIAQKDFYSFEAKYLDDKGSKVEIPARLSDEQIKAIRELAVKSYQVLCCEGMGRVDFFLTDDNRLLVNEINTLPGFTKISMYPKMWEHSGISYSELLDRLIQLAIDRFRQEQRLKTSRI